MKRTPANYPMEVAGTSAISEVAKRWNWIWRPNPPPDTGVDGTLEVVEAPNEATGKQLAVQSKAGRSYIHNETAETFEFHAKENDVRYWEGYSLPVLLIVYDPSINELYGISVRDYLRDKPEALRRPHRFVFNKETDRIADDVSRHWIRDVACLAPRSYTTRLAVSVSEILHTNLLPVISMPDRVFAFDGDGCGQSGVRERSRKGAKRRWLGGVQGPGRRQVIPVA